MKLYVFKKDDLWYAGRSPTGRVKTVPNFEDGVFFTEETKEEAEDCFDLGYSLYSVEVGAPVLEKEGSQGKSTSGVAPMNL